MEGCTFKMDGYKTRHQKISLIRALCGCFSVCGISSAAVFVNAIWFFGWKHCRVQNTRQPDKITLGTRIHYQDDTAAALGHTRVSPYFTESNHRRCFPLHRSVQCDNLFCTYGYGPERNSSWTMPIFFLWIGLKQGSPLGFYNINLSVNNIIIYIFWHGNIKSYHMLMIHRGPILKYNFNHVIQTKQNPSVRSVNPMPCIT